MNLLIERYNKNKGKHSLFSDIIYIDYYDGGTQAICKLDHTEQWLICSLTYFNIKDQVRVFALIEAKAEWASRIKSGLDSDKTGKEYKNLKAQVKNAFDDYSGNAYLMKAEKLEDINYEVIEVPFSGMMYFETIEDVLAQDEKHSLYWAQFFKV